MKKVLICNLLLLVVFLTLTSMLTSCGGSSANESNSAVTSDKSEDIADASDTENISQYDVPETRDYDGYEFRIAINNFRNVDHYVLISGGLNGEIINDTVFARNIKIEEKYNIKVSDSAVDPSDNVPSKVKTSVLAGDDYCDAAFYSARDHFAHAQEGYLIDINTVEAFDFEQPYWDSEIIRDFSIYGKNYGFTGDITTEDDLLVLIMLYNSKVYEDYNFENPYQMVTSGLWTFDRFWNMAKSTSMDLNGDGVMDCDDQWGFIGEAAAWYYYSTGAGLMPLEIAVDGGRRFVLDDEKTLNILEKTKKMIIEPGVTFIADDGNSKFYNGAASCWDGCDAMFMDNHCLFYSGCFRELTHYRDMKVDFGILPMPKYDEAQESYHNLVTYHVDVGTLPITVTDPERSALILSAMSYESMLTLNPCFYDVFLDEKLARDEESKGMIDLILDTKVYDMDWTAQVSTLGKIMEKLSVERSDDFTSRWASARSTADANLEKFLTAFAG